MNLSEQVKQLRAVADASRDPPGGTPLQVGKPSIKPPVPVSAADAAMNSKSDSDVKETALKICETYLFNRRAADGIMKQVLLDIGNKPPETIMLYLVEVLDRMSGGGDVYIKQVKEQLTKADL